MSDTIEPAAPLVTGAEQVLTPVVEGSPSVVIAEAPPMTEPPTDAHRKARLETAKAEIIAAARSGHLDRLGSAIVAAFDELRAA